MTCAFTGLSGIRRELARTTIKRSDYLRWCTDCKRVRGHILRNNSSSAHDRSFAYPNTIQQNRARPDPGTITYLDPRCGYALLNDRHGGIVKDMINRQHLDARRQEDMIANSHTSLTAKDAGLGDVAVVPNPDTSIW
jgi:hypothetical protein